MAEKSLKEELKELVDTDPKIVGAAGVLGGAAVGDALALASTIPGALSEIPSRMVDKVKPNPLLDKLKRVARQLDTEVVVGKGLPHGFKSGDANFRQLIQVPKGATPHSFAHELGHANPKGRLFGGKLLDRSYDFGKVSPIFAGLVGAAAASQLLSDEDPKKAKRIAQGGAAISAVATLPMLYEEGRASVLGVKHLREAGMSIKDIIKKSLPMITRQASYPGLALLPALGLYLGSKLIQEDKNDKS